jgi:hypothetical protein
MNEKNAGPKRRRIDRAAAETASLNTLRTCVIGLSSGK